MFDIKYQTISLTRGDSATLTVELVKANGEPYELQEGNNHTLTVYTGNKSTSSYGFPPDTELQYIVIYSS